MSAPPRQIGPCQIIEKLGSGGMGDVYRAFDPAMNRPLAIKLLRVPQLASEEETEEMQLQSRRGRRNRLPHQCRSK